MAILPTPSELKRLHTPTERLLGAALSPGAQHLEDRLSYLEAAEERYDRDRSRIMGRNAALGAFSGAAIGLAAVAAPSIPERAVDLVYGAANRIQRSRAEDALITALNTIDSPSQFLAGMAAKQGKDELAVNLRLGIGTDGERRAAARSRDFFHETVRQSPANNTLGPADFAPGGSVDKQWMLAQEVADIPAEFKNPYSRNPLQGRQSGLALDALTSRSGGTLRPEHWDEALDAVGKYLPESRSRSILGGRVENIHKTELLREQYVDPLLSRFRKIRSHINTPARTWGVIGGAAALGTGLGAWKARSKMRETEPLLNASRDEKREFLRQNVGLPGEPTSNLSYDPATPMAHTTAYRAAEPFITLLELAP